MVFLGGVHHMPGTTCSSKIFAEGIAVAAALFINPIKLQENRPASAGRFH
jgi:hypothetical protein